MLRLYTTLKRIQKPNVRFLRNNNHSAVYPRLLRDFPKTQCSVLSNGLTVATEERQCNNVCIGFYIDAGSRHENESENGITHFFEHIAFKGTTNTSKTDLESEIGKTGAKFQCFTTRDTSVYYAECLSSEAKCVADILFDCIFNNSFSDTEIEIQKNTVRDEMLMHDRFSVNILHDYLHSSAFQGTQLGQTVMGPSSNLHNLKSPVISDYITKLFIPERIVFAAVGNIKHDLMMNLGQQYCIATECPKCVSLGSLRYTGSQIVYRDDSMDVGHIAIAVEGPSFGDKDKIVMELAALVLGGWDKSQPSGTTHGVHLACVASAGGLCKSYKTFQYYYQDVGLWGVEYISSRDEVDDMLLAVQNEWMRLCYLITDDELIRAKNEMKSKIIMNYQSTVYTCHDIGYNILRNGHYSDLHEIISIIDKITANDLKNVCGKYIYDRCPVVAGIGSTENLLSYSRIRSYMYWLRV